MTEVKLPTSGKGSPRGKPFAAGHDENRNKGREKGSHNKTTRILKEAMLLAAAQLGDLSGIAREDLPTPNIETGKDELVQLSYRPTRNRKANSRAPVRISSLRQRGFLSGPAQ
jgi:hypothetical protein